MKSSIELVKMFYTQALQKGNIKGLRLSYKQAEWLRNVYLKENPNTTYTNKPILIFEKNSTNHYRLNTDNSLYFIEK